MIVTEELESLILHDSILFFDLDGTLVDTNYANFLAYEKAIKTIKDIKIEFVINERFTRSSLLKVIPDLTFLEIEKIIQLKEDIYSQYLSHTKPIKYTIDILEKYHKINKTILITNCRENRVISILSYYKLLDKFSHFFCRRVDNKRINKFEYAIKKLDISTNSIILFENEDNEIQDALNQKIQFKNIIKIQ